MTRNGLKKQVLRKSKYDVTAIQRFIRLVKVLLKVLQDLSEPCEPLRRLTHKKADWNWTHEQE